MKATLKSYHISKMGSTGPIFWPTFSDFSLRGRLHYYLGGFFTSYVGINFDAKVRPLPDLTQRPSWAQNDRLNLPYKKFSETARFYPMTASSERPACNTASLGHCCESYDVFLAIGFRKEILWVWFTTYIHFLLNGKFLCKISQSLWKW